MPSMLQTMLLFSGGAPSPQTLVSGDFDSAITRAPADGMFLAVKDLNFSAFGTHSYFALYDDADDTIEYGIDIQTGGALDIVENGSVVAASVFTAATGTNYDVFIVLDEDKYAHYFIRSSTNDYRRIWVGSYASAVALVYASEANTGGTYTEVTEYFGLRLFLGAAPVDIDAPSVGALTALPDGDFLAKMGVTVPSAGNLDLAFRQQDSTHEWIQRVTSAGALSLQEDNAGLTSRATATPPITTGMSLMLLANGISIASRYNGTATWAAYTAAYNFLRNTGFQLNDIGTGGALANLKAWKAYLRETNGLGSELAVDGGMSINITNWPAVSVPTTREYIGGRLHVITAAGSVGVQVAAAINTTAGKYYAFSFDYEIVSGNMEIRWDSTGTVVRAANGLTGTGTLTFYAFADASTVPMFLSGTGAGEWYIDNVSIKEVLFAGDSLATTLDGVLA